MSAPAASTASNTPAVVNGENDDGNGEDDWGEDDEDDDEEVSTWVQLGSVEVFVERHRANGYAVPPPTANESLPEAQLVTDMELFVYQYRLAYGIILRMLTDSNFELEETADRIEDGTLSVGQTLTKDDWLEVGGPLVDTTQRPNFAETMTRLLGPPLSEGLSHDELRRRADAYATAGCEVLAWNIHDGPKRRVSLILAAQLNYRQAHEMYSEYVYRYMSYMQVSSYEPFTADRRREAMLNAFVDMIPLRQVRVIDKVIRQYLIKMAISYQILPFVIPVNVRNCSPDIILQRMVKEMHASVLLPLDRIYTQEIARAQAANKSQRVEDVTRAQRVLHQDSMYKRLVDAQSMRAAHVTQVREDRSSMALPTDVTLLIESFVHRMQVTTREDVIQVMAQGAADLQAIAASSSTGQLTRVAASLRKAADDLEHIAKRPRVDDSQ